MKSVNRKNGLSKYEIVDDIRNLSAVHDSVVYLEEMKTFYVFDAYNSYVADGYKVISHATSGYWFGVAGQYTHYGDSKYIVLTAADFSAGMFYADSAVGQTYIITGLATDSNFILPNNTTQSGKEISINLYGNDAYELTVRDHLMNSVDLLYNTGTVVRYLPKKSGTPGWALVERVNYDIGYVTFSTLNIGVDQNIVNFGVSGSVGYAAYNVSTTQTLTNAHQVNVNNTANITITLPSGYNQREIYIKKISNNNNTVTIIPYTGQNIFGGTKYLQTYGEYIELYLYSGVWYIKSSTRKYDFKYTATSLNYTVLDNDEFVNMIGSNDKTVTMPTNISSYPTGKRLTIKNGGLGRVTINSPSVLIDNYNSVKLPVLYDSITLIKKSDNTWAIEHLTNSSGGVYTPTLTKLTNVNTLTVSSIFYNRSGEVVNVNLKCRVTATAAGFSEFRVSLPIPTVFSDNFQAIGNGFSLNSAMMEVFADNSNEAIVQYTAPDNSPHDYIVSFSYLII